MRHILFLVVVVSSATLIGALIFSIVHPTLRVWPAPQRNERAWRVRLILHQACGVMVALTGVGVHELALADRGSLHLPGGVRWFAGLAIFGFGAAFGLWGYARLGVNASHGAVAPLEVSGPYRYSRNPQYVGAIGVLLGISLLFASKLGLLAGAACSIWFATAPFAEEPWLRQHLGAGYDDYVKSAARYLGFPRHSRGAA